MRKRHYLIAGLALSMMVSTEAQDARACGGTFCDSGPQAMPVDQSGENVLFVMDGKTVEAHVQIQYQGAAERFAWIVPMPKVPDVQVGSALLFNALLQGTVPQFGFTQQTDVCDRGNSDSASGAGGSGGGSLGMGGAAGGAGSGPQVVYEKTVGAFEVVVLQGGTAEEVGKWLVDNNYQNIPTAPEILWDYVAQKYVFVAIKLTAGANSNEIHPLVFRSEGDDPCVPLKLARRADLYRGQQRLELGMTNLDVGFTKRWGQLEAALVIGTRLDDHFPNAGLDGRFGQRGDRSQHPHSSN